MTPVTRSGDFFSFMATQTKQDPVQNALLDYMLKQQQNPGAQTNQAVQTIMSNPDIAKAYTDRVNYYNSTNQDLAKTVDDQAKNGVNGMAVNVSPNFQELASAIPQNQAMTNSFLASLVGAASGETNNTQNAAANAYGTQQQTGLDEQQLNLQKKLNGIDPTTGQWEGANGSTSGASPLTIAQLSQQGAGDLLARGKTPAEQLQIARDIQGAGGVGSYRKQLGLKGMSPDDASTLSNTNDTLQKVNYVTNQLKKSKMLQSILDNPIFSVLYGNGDNKWVTNNILRLSPQDQQALSYLKNLNAISDKSQVGGRLDNYLLQQFGPAGVGIHQNSSTNVQMLKNIQSKIKDNLGFFAGQKGFDSTYDLPGIKFDKVTMKAPNGGMYQVDPAEASQALKNGWKEAQ